MKSNVVCITKNLPLKPIAFSVHVSNSLLAQIASNNDDLYPFPLLTHVATSFARITKSILFNSSHCPEYGSLSYPLLILYHHLHCASIPAPYEDVPAVHAYIRITRGSQNAKQLHCPKKYECTIFKLIFAWPPLIIT